MKTVKYILPVLIMFSLTQSSCSKDDEDKTTSNPVPKATLTAEEEADLIFMREEEKLARDVYLYAFDLYGIPVFSNISNSEQTHMDQVLSSLTTYGMSDPASGQRGIFNNSQLQQLYIDLIAEVDKSVLSAFLVGTTIEDLDIRDLIVCESRTLKADLLAMYQNLRCGSRNHMRSFYTQVDAKGGSYNAQYITQANFLEIISTPSEKCGQ
jgi:hypothetical protein